MADNAGGDGLGRFGWIIVGLGLVSLPLLRTPLGLGEQGAGAVGADTTRRICASGLAYEPFCYEDDSDSIGVGSDLLTQFYGIRRTTPLPTIACGAPVRALVATLPDPVQSHNAASTDAFLYALSRAHERAGFVIDRFWLPWSLGKAGTSQAARDAELASTQPGALLFRRSGWLPGDSTARAAVNLSLVYLVGETPTRGLDKAAFRRALADLGRLRRGCRDSLRIIAPYFSGSAPSLDLSLNTLAPDVFPRIALVSGSATAWGNRRLGTSGADRGISYRATVHSDSAYRLALVEVTQALGLDTSQVATLTERATAYGQSITTVAASGAGAQRALDIAFPMNIATIRVAYEAAASRGGKPEEDRLQLGPRVPLGGADQDAYRDVLPTYSAVTVATQEIFLDQIAGLLAEHGVLLLGLQATDPRDKLFLARELHRRLPSLKFYTFESNALYLRPDFESALEGMLVFSTYPLTPDPAHGRGLELLPSDPAFGVYNATLVQLGQDSLVSYAAPLRGQDPAGPIRPPVWVTVVGAGSMEPLRYQVDHVDGPLFPPIRPAPDPGARVPRRYWPQIGFLLLGLAIAWRPGVEVLRRIRPRGRGPTRTASAGRQDEGLLAPVWRRCRGLGGDPRPEHLLCWYAGESREFSAMGRLSLAAVLFPLAILFGSVAPGEPGGWTHNRWFVAAEASLPLLVTLVSLGVAVRRLPRRHFSALMAGGVYRGIPEMCLRALLDLATFWYLLVTLLFALGVLLVPDQHGAAALFWIRTRALDSRLSPLLVVALVGITVSFWCAWHRRRSDLLRRPTRLECALGAGVSAAATGDTGPFRVAWGAIAERMHGLRWCLALLAPSRRSVLTFLLCVLGAVLLRGSAAKTLESVVAIDAPLIRWTLSFGFEWVLWFGLVTGLMLTVVSVERMLALWSALRDILRQVERLPLRVAFERLPAQLTSLAGLLPQEHDQATWADWQEHRWRQLTNLANPEAEAPGAGPEAEVGYRVALAEAMAATPLELRVPRLIGALGWYWSTEPSGAVAQDVQVTLRELRDLPADPESGTSALGSKFRRSVPDRGALWMRGAEEYVAAEVVEYIDWALGSLRWIAVFLVVALVTTSLLLAVYPLAYERTVQLYFMGLLFSTLLALGWVMVQLNRNHTISRIMRTTPGRLTWDRSLLTNLFVLVGVPLLSYLGTAVPELHHLLLGWLEPLAGVVAR